MVARILLKVRTKLKNMTVLKTQKAEKESKFRLFNDRVVLSGRLTTEKERNRKNRMILKHHICCSVLGETRIGVYWLTA